MSKKRAMSSEKASQVKKQGHADAREFANLIGLGKEFDSDPRAKKDVIDTEGNTYSVKSGLKKWQIFLYGKKRFEENFTFRGLSGLGDLFLECINSFPENRDDYLKDKNKYKQNLQEPMKKLCEKLKNKDILGAFLEKGLFNSGEVNFLVIKDKEKFHIFWYKDVIEVLRNNYTVENSKARTKKQLDAQKVVFKVNGKTHGEIEMRNDSNIHYREVKFWLDKTLTFNLLKEKIQKYNELKERIVVYGGAISKLKKILSK